MTEKQAISRRLIGFLCVEKTAMSTKTEFESGIVFAVVNITLKQKNR